MNISQAIHEGTTTVSEICDKTHMPRHEVLTQLRKLDGEVGKLVLGRRGRPTRFEKKSYKLPIKTDNLTVDDVIALVKLLKKLDKN